MPYFEEPLSDYNQSLSLTSKLDSLQTEDFILDTILAQIIEVDTFELNMLEDSPFFAIRFNKFTNWALQGDIYLWRNDYSKARRVYDRVTDIMANEGFAGTTRLPYIGPVNFQDVNWKDIFQFNYSSGPI